MSLENKAIVDRNRKFDLAVGPLMTKYRVVSMFFYRGKRDALSLHGATDQIC